MSDALFQTAEQIRAGQLEALNDLLTQILPANAFYARKVGTSALPKTFSTLEDFQRRFPFTTKQEIAHDQEQHPPYGRNLTYPLERYTRLNQTSGTSGKPLRWLDTA
ncbi:MAG TPA: phenylacetate--CoA ligase family protein, partial [Verrucomicrobiae bacterium]|nr:phenylacetate--CoA ligase family protein [Verrucomicrobiae bacterium]